MQVYLSTKTPVARRVYHKPGCIYVKRIKRANRMFVPIDEAERNGYCECSYCAGLKGEVRIHSFKALGLKKEEKFEIMYERRTDTAYVTTEIGAWKIFLNKFGKYCLFHMNRYFSEMSRQEIERAAYHCQRDVKPSDSFEKIVRYVVDHDRAKMIIMDDYRKLPIKTKKQRKYYKRAEKKEGFRRKRRMDALFMSIERGNPELKQYSIC